MTHNSSRLIIDIVPGQKHQSKLYFIFYALTYLGLSLRIIPQNIAVAFMVIIFFLSPLDVMPYLYCFSLPWTYVAKFSFGLTLSLMQSIVYIGKKSTMRHQFKIALYEFIIVTYLLLSGITGFIINKSFTEISFVIYFLIVCDMKREFFHDKDIRNDFINKMLLSILISVIMAIIYGVMYNTAHSRWIGNLGYYSNQLSGTMGTSRFGMYLCISLLYPLYHIENRRWKVIICCFLSIAVVSTISLTAVALLLMVYTVYFLSKMKNIRKAFAVLFMMLLMFSIFYYFWTPISNISLLKPVISRVNFTYTRMQMGDLDNATSGRSTLMDNYLTLYSEQPIINKLLGSHSIRGDSAQYSHNSYLDMLNCFGIVGCILILFLQLRRIIEYFKYEERNELLLLKAIVLLGAASVSIFTAQYWQVFLYF